MGAVLALGFFCFRAMSDQSVALAWDANSEPNVSGYKLYYGTASGVYTNSLNITNGTAVTVPGLKEGLTYFFALTACSVSGLESARSSEIRYDVPIVFTIAGPSLLVNLGSQSSDPKSLSFLAAPNKTYELQSTENLQTWSTLWYSTPVTASQLLEYTDMDPSPSGMRFYRLLVH